MCFLKPARNASTNRFLISTDFNADSASDSTHEPRRAGRIVRKDSQDMREQFDANPDAYTRIMNNDLLPIVYHRCNTLEG